MHLRAEKREMSGILALFCSVKFLLVLVSLLFSDALLYILEWIYGDGAEGAFSSLTGMDTLSGVLTEALLFILCAFVPLALYFFFSRKTFSETVMTERPKLMQIGFGVGATVIIGQVASVAGNVILDMLFRLFGNNDYMEEIAGAANENYPDNVWVVLGYMVLMSVFPAFFEEFLVRGVGISAVKKYGTCFTLFFSGFFFAFLHNTWQQLPLAFAVGILSAYFTLRFRSIWVAVIAHFAFNLNGAVSSLLISADEENMTGLLGWYGIFYPLMLGLFIAGWIIYGFRKPDVPKSEYSKKERFRILFSNPFLYVFVFLAVFRLALILITA